MPATTRSSQKKKKKEAPVPKKTSALSAKLRSAKAEQQKKKKKKKTSVPKKTSALGAKVRSQKKVTTNNNKKKKKIKKKRTTETATNDGGLRKLVAEQAATMLALLRFSHKIDADTKRLRAYIDKNATRFAAHFSTTPETQHVIASLLDAVGAVVEDTHAKAQAQHASWLQLHERAGAGDAAALADAQALTLRTALLVRKAEEEYYPRMQTLQRLVTLVAQRTRAEERAQHAADMAQRQGWYGYFSRGWERLASSIDQLRQMARAAGWVLAGGTVLAAVKLLLAPLLAAAASAAVIAALATAVGALLCTVVEAPAVVGAALQTMFVALPLRGAAAMQRLWLALVADRDAAAPFPNATSIGVDLLGRDARPAAMTAAVSAATAATVADVAAEAAVASVADGRGGGAELRQPADSGNPLAAVARYVVSLGCRLLLAIFLPLCRLGDRLTGVKALAGKVKRGYEALQRGGRHLRSLFGAAAERDVDTSELATTTATEPAPVTATEKVTAAEATTLLSAEMHEQLQLLADQLGKHGAAFAADVKALTDGLQKKIDEQKAALYDKLAERTLAEWSWHAFSRLASRFGALLTAAVNVAFESTVAVLDDSIVSDVPRVAIPLRFRRDEQTQQADADAMLAAWRADEAARAADLLRADAAKKNKGKRQQQQADDDDEVDAQEEDEEEGPGDDDSEQTLMIDDDSGDEGNVDSSVSVEYY